MERIPSPIPKDVSPPPDIRTSQPIQRERQGQVGLARCPFRVSLYSVFSIRVKRPPKPDPVKRRPPTARRFYFTELAVPLVYIFVSSHVLANVANAAPSQATVEIHHAALSSLPQPSCRQAGKWCA